MYSPSVVEALKALIIGKHYTFVVEVHIYVDHCDLFNYDLLKYWSSWSVQSSLPYSSSHVYFIWWTKPALKLFPVSAASLKEYHHLICRSNPPCIMWTYSNPQLRPGFRQCQALGAGVFQAPCVFLRDILGRWEMPTRRPKSCRTWSQVGEKTPWFSVEGAKYIEEIHIVLRDSVGS